MNLTTRRLLPFYIAYYATQCIYQNYFTVHMSDIGLSSAQIGTILSLASLASLVGQPVWGAIGDRIKAKNTLLRILLVLAAAAIVCTSFGVSALYIGVMMCLFTFSYLSIQPMGDTIALESLGREGLSFGPVRVTGTITYATLSAITGAIIGAYMNRLPWIVAAALLLTFCATFTMPRVSGHRKKGDGHSFREIFKNKTILPLLLFSACLMVGMSVFYNFFSIYLTKELGGSTALLGWCFFISSGSEVPFLLFGDKLFKKYGIGIALIFAGIMMSTRWILLSQVKSPYLATATQALHFGCFIMLTFNMSKYINNVVDNRFKAAGQLLFTLFTLGFARIAGSFVGGQIANIFGYRMMFLCAAIFTLCGLAVFVVYVIRHNSELLEGSRGEVHHETAA